MMDLRCDKEMFGNRKVSLQLDFNYDADEVDINACRKRISVSGAQEKVSAVVDKGKIRLTAEGESGRYLIKPIPGDKGLMRRHQMPANEYLTMQIARRVFHICTASNGLVAFKDGDLAYITRRFDYAEDGSKIAQEDFASLAGKSLESLGNDYKYQGSYLEIGALIRKNVSAWRVAMVEFYKLVIFNYLFSNGDAHLKNFSVQQTVDGDYLLSPAYDLLNTALHVNDEDFCLSEGLMPEKFHSKVWDVTGHPCQSDFITFGGLLGIPDKKIAQVIALYLSDDPQVKSMIDDSFLDKESRRIYWRTYQERLARFRRTEGDQ